MGAEIHFLELKSQFRCNGSDGFITWLDEALGIIDDEDTSFEGVNYDFKVFDDPSKLYEEIRSKNAEANKSRMLAGYCWDWISKSDPKEFDITFPKFDFKAKWNLESRGSAWLIDPASIDDIGCIHTSQGLELDYVGVIIGGDLKVVDGELITDPSGRASTDVSLHGYKKEFKENPELAAKKADQIIRNTYRTLMTRGMKGCYIYCTDSEVAKYFNERLNRLVLS
jgi:DUF2075 family protein